MDGLPEELLDHIISEVDLETLKCLAQLSPKFRRLTALRLRYYSHTHRDLRNRHEFRHLIATFIHRPDLAAYMKAVDIQDMEWAENLPVDPYQGNFPDPVPPEDLAALFCSSAETLDIADKNDFMTLLRQGKEAAEMTLFLSLLPNLERLTIRWVFYLSSRSITNLVKAAIPGPSQHSSPSQLRRPFSRLHTLTLSDDSDAPLNKVLQLFLPLPSLHTIHNANEPNPFARTSEGILIGRLHSRFSRVKHAIFTHTRLSVYSIRTFSNMCHSLISLVVHWDNSNSIFSFHAEMLRKTIEEHAGSLEQLVLDTGDATGLPALGNLKCLHRLKALHISGQLLTGFPEHTDVHDLDSAAAALEPANLLPGPALEVLSLGSATEGDTAFERFLASLAVPGMGKKEAFPALRQVEVWPTSDKGHCVGRKFLERLRGVFGSWGVELVGEELGVKEGISFGVWKNGKVVDDATGSGS